MTGLRWLSFAVAAVLFSPTAHADIAVSANDAHSTIVNGVSGMIKDAPSDNVSVIDLSQSPPRITGSVDAPASVVGPAQGIFVAKDESFAIVASANRVENGVVVVDDRVSVIDLSVSPPQVVQQVKAGAAPNSVAVNAATVDLGNPKSTPAGVVFAPDGKTAFVARDGFISVLDIDGEKVQVDPKQVIIAVRPYPIDISPDGKLLAVANSWGPSSDIGTVTLIDLSSKPYRVVDAARTPSVSEGLRFSPDGKFLATSSLNGSTAAPTSLLYKDHALLTVFAVGDKTLTRTAEAPLGKWSQGVAFSRNGATILVQNMMEKNISVFSFAEGKLTAQPPLAIPKGAPATIGTARP